MTRYFLALFLAVFASLAQAVPTTITLGWTNPTISSDGVPLTGANALTGVLAFCSTTTIPDVAANAADPFAPSASFGVVQTGPVTVDANNGDTVYCRVRAVAGTKKSPLSNQASKPIVLDTTPGAPGGATIIKIEITINGVTKTITFP